MFIIGWKNAEMQYFCSLSRRYTHLHIIYLALLFLNTFSSIIHVPTIMNPYLKYTLINQKEYYNLPNALSWIHQMIEGQGRAHHKHYELISISVETDKQCIWMRHISMTRRWRTLLSVYSIKLLNASVNYDWSYFSCVAIILNVCSHCLLRFESWLYE